MDDSLADLTPLEQRRMRLRAYADRVLEAVEALPMPKTALEGERTLRAVTACDRMLIQIYNKVGRQQQIQPQIMPPVARPPQARTERSGRRKDGTALKILPF